MLWPFWWKLQILKKQTCYFEFGCPSTRFRVPQNSNDILNLVRHDHNYFIEEIVKDDQECDLVDIDQCIEDDIEIDSEQEVIVPLENGEPRNSEGEGDVSNENLSNEVSEKESSGSGGQVSK